MAALGADVEALRQLAGAMRSASARLDDIAVGLDGRTRSTGWRGVDAERFAREWSLRHRPALLLLGDRCSQLARSLEAQVTQQVHASRPEPNTPSRATSLADAAPHAAAPHAAAALPVREERYLGGVEIKVGFFSGALRGDMSVQQLPDGRARISVSEYGALGVTAGLGTSTRFSIGDQDPVTTPTSGVQAEARARLGSLERRTWELPADQVPGLLARLAADEVIAAAAPGSAVSDGTGGSSVGGPLTASAARTVGGLVDGVVERITGTDPGVDDRLEALVSIPAPSRSERLLEVDLVAGAGAALAGSSAPAVHASATGTVRAGTARSDTARSTIAEYHGGASAALSASLLGRFGVAAPDDARSVQGLRLELVEQRDGSPGHLLATLSSSDGSELTESVVRLDLTGPGAEHVAVGLRRVLGSLAGGNVRGALDAASELRSADVAVDRVRVSTSSATISGTTVDGGFSAGAGVVAGVSARGQVLHLERHD